jgi:hypothetical protein
VEVGQGWCQEEHGQASTDGLTQRRCESPIEGERHEGGIEGL